MYHAIEERRSVLSVSPAIFAWQMRWLSERGYRIISLSDLVRHLRNNAPLPDRSVVITFDDGLESVYTSAFPILERYGFPATVFLVPDYCGRWNDWPSQPSVAPRLPLLSWPQIREMDRYGVEFGAHTLSHPRLDRLSRDEVEREILGSKASIEEHLGHPVEVFAYPYGRHNDTSGAVVRRAYTGACAGELKLVGPGSDPLALERIDAYYVTQPLLFRGLSRPWFPLYLGLRRPLRTIASAVLRRAWS